MKGIPEQRLVDAWNLYAATIGAPGASQASSAEVHNLRDAFLTMARLSEHREYKNFWAVASIYSTQADGSLAPACRPIEAIRILWDFANKPDNLLGARERVQKGMRASDEFREALEKPAASRISAGRVEARVRPFTPVELAASQYIAEHGLGAWQRLVVSLLDNLLTG